MTEVGTMTGPASTLADEHVCLLCEVTARADELLTATVHDRWPAAELAALAAYVQAEVLRQASDEESLLFPAVHSREVKGLARDHARLRAAAELLARAAAGEQPMSPARLAAVVRDFIVQFTRHLRQEEALLASGTAPRGTAGTVALGGHPHEWYPLTEGPTIDLDALPPGQAVAAAVDRLLRMRRGERVELRSGTELEPVWREMSDLTPGDYRFVSLRDGPLRWRMQVTRHQVSD
ncbi:MAG: hemerythrin domain-containing protein [Trebonia sp.]